jgi:hypothetical protein
MSIEIQLSRLDRVYHPGQKVTGSIVIRSDSSLSYNAINLRVHAQINLQLSARTIGLLEAFYNTLAPTELMNLDLVVAKGGKCRGGITEFPFEFVVQPNQKSQMLHDTYHGVYVNIQYLITCDVVRGIMSKDLQKTKEFIVNLLPDKQLTSQLRASDHKFPFSVTPKAIQNLGKGGKDQVDFDFLFEGHMDSLTCDVTQPFTGEVVIRHSEAAIASVELQLVRVESCRYQEGVAKEPTEIQNIQIADGDIVRNLTVPIYMVFPRLFTCSTVKGGEFSVDFEVNLIIQFESYSTAKGKSVTQNFPIRLFRG